VNIVNRSLGSLLVSVAALVINLTVNLYASPIVLRISGTGSGTGGMQLAAKAFMDQNAGVKVKVLPAIGSNGGIAALMAGRIDIAVANRAPNDKELAQAKLSHWEYARTPFVIAVAKSLDIQKLSVAEYARLYADGAASFPGGRRARPILRLSDAVDTKLMKAFGPSVAEAVEQASKRPGMLSGSTDSETADLIEKTPGGFGPSTLAQMLSERRSIVALTIGDYSPSVENLVKGQYPFSKSLYLIHADKPDATVLGFVQFLKSPAAKKLLGDAGHWMQ
jgi:phosphate transport system substrate-binding protein